MTFAIRAFVSCLSVLLMIPVQTVFELFLPIEASIPLSFGTIVPGTTIGSFRESNGRGHVAERLKEATGRLGRAESCIWDLLCASENRFKLELRAE